MKSARTLAPAALLAAAIAAAAGGPALAADRYAPVAPVVVGDYDTVGAVGHGLRAIEQSGDVIAFATRLPEDATAIGQMKRFDHGLRLLER